MANDKDKGPTYTITPFSGTPGQDWEDFEDELYNALALKTDDRGSSLADTLEGTDEGGARMVLLSLLVQMGKKHYAYATRG